MSKNAVRTDASAPQASYLAWKSWHAEGFGQATRGDARYFHWLVRRVGAGSARSVLELGFGNGHFLGWARDQGWQVAGVELQAPLLERAAAAGLPVWASLDDMPADARFDLIAAFDVLEHVPQDQLPALLVQLLAHLSPAGRLVLRVPNGESPWGRVHQHGDLTHCTTLGVSKFRQLALPLGLEVDPVGEAPWHALQHAGRSPKNLLRALLRAAVARTLAFAYRWDARTLGPNLLVALRRSDG